MKRKLLMLGVLLLCCFCMIPTPLFANSNDVSNLTIECPVSNMNISLYRVADENRVLTNKFSNYSIDLNQKDESGWQGVANVLENHILKDQIEADYSALSDDSLHCFFNGLASGIYLAIPQEVEKDGWFYTPQVSLISLTRDLVVDLKYEKNDKPVLTKTSLHVLKVWKMDYKKDRPTSIEVSLLKTDASGNTVVADQQVLNNQNQWSYTWEDLSTLYKYSVLETKVPSGYKESCMKEKNSVILTNTGNRKEKKKKKDKELPLTGQLWWPVPVLLFVGLALFGLGRQLRNEK